MRTPEGSARPHPTATLDPGDTPDTFPTSGPPPSTLPGPRARSTPGHVYHAVHLTALDHVCFVAPYVLIAEDNSSPARVATQARARAALARADVATIAGQLRPGVLAADIDPDPDHAVHGDAVAEQLLAWCHRHHVPFLLRESGRPGGRHVLAVTTSPTLTATWARLCAVLARRWRVVVDDRTGTALRLLSAPHRHGRPAPVLGGTLTPAHLLDLPRDLPGRHATAAQLDPAQLDPGRVDGGQLDAGPGDVELAPAVAPGARPSSVEAPRAMSPARPRGPGVDTSRSAAEYGRACAHARAGHTTEQAWADVDHPGTHARNRGHPAWLAYVWMPAVTTVAAEHGLTEDAAWRLARDACPRRCADRGRAWWRGLWRRALAEAAHDRPRRHHLTADPRPDHAGPDTPTTSTPEQLARLAALRHLLHTSAADLLPQRGTRPQRVHSVQALLYALAAVLVSDRAGSISHRDLAERAHLDVKTVRAAIRAALTAGLIVVTHHYTGGATDSHAYAPGPALTPHLTSADTTNPAADPATAAQTSPTSCSTPPAPLGTAQVATLRARHAAERTRWRLRCTLVEALAGTATTFAASQHSAAKALRSLHYQRSWWRSLTPAQQDDRRALRRAVLGRLSIVDRSTWLTWLTRREHLRLTVERVGHDVLNPTDRATLAAAPLTLHRGMRDPLWRLGGTPGPLDTEQLALVA